MIAPKVGEIAHELKEVTFLQRFNEYCSSCVCMRAFFEKGTVCIVELGKTL